MNDGTLKKVKDIKKGDILKGNVVVKCSIETEVNKEIEIIKFESGLIITKYHPVLFNHIWTFPIDCGNLVKIFIDKYYNFVLQSGHIMKVNEI